MHSVISEKGQITVPKRLRERLGIRSGDRLEFAEERGRLVLTKATEQDAVSAVYGLLGKSSSTDEVMRELRGEADAA